MGWRRQTWWTYYVLIYKNGKMRTVEEILRGGTMKIDRGVNITKIYYKHFCEYHYTPSTVIY
jgi:hypothetical protein